MALLARRNLLVTKAGWPTERPATSVSSTSRRTRRSVRREELHRPGHPRRSHSRKEERAHRRTERACGYQNPRDPCRARPRSESAVGAAGGLVCRDTTPRVSERPKSLKIYAHIWSKYTML